MVPITIVAFLLGIAATASIKVGQQLFNGLKPSIWDYMGLATASVGVFLFNWY